jgi:hypothetical protein
LWHWFPKSILGTPHIWGPYDRPQIRGFPNWTGTLWSIWGRTIKIVPQLDPKSVCPLWEAVPGIGFGFPWTILYAIYLYSSIVTIFKKVKYMCLLNKVF